MQGKNRALCKETGHVVLLCRRKYLDCTEASVRDDVKKRRVDVETSGAGIAVRRYCRKEGANLLYENQMCFLLVDFILDNFSEQICQVRSDYVIVEALS